MRKAIALAFTLFLTNTISVADDATGSKPFANAINPHQEPIPVETAPADLKRLITDGHVKIVYDAEPDFLKSGRGWADFHIQLRHTFKYSISTFRKSGAWLAKVVVTEFKPQIELSHLIRLPESARSPAIWRNRILRHEFDHVAVSLDPRPMMLLRRLLERMPPIERGIESKDVPSDEMVSGWINEEVNRRLQAVRELIRQNNLRLDKVGAHGSQPVPHRVTFFTELYSKKQLAESKFPYLSEVLELVDSNEYQQTDLPFLDVDPQDR